jgi:hypothetical protein
VADCSVTHLVEVGVPESCRHERREVTVSSVRRLAPLLIALFGALMGSADAQNLDAGKSPAQIFSDTCAACHKNARELRRTSAGFLRSHYTTGQEAAGAMASYLAGIGSDPRAVQQRRPPGALTPADAAKQPPRPQIPVEQATTTPGQPAPKGARRPLSTGSVDGRPMTTAASEDNASETALVPPSATPIVATPAPVVLTAPAVAARAPAAPVLEPFEE